MTRDEVEAIVVTELARKLYVNEAEIGPDLLLVDDLDLDSVDLADLIIYVEHRLGTGDGTLNGEPKTVGELASLLFAASAESDV
jgi:hypothetical protein